MNIAGKELLILGINRSPKANSADYFLKLDLFMWSTTLKHHVVVLGDLNPWKYALGQKRREIGDKSGGNLQFQMSIGLYIRVLHQPRKGGRVAPKASSGLNRVKGEFVSSMQV